MPDSGTQGRRRHARAQRITAAEIKTKGEFPVTSISSMTKEERAAATAPISSAETYIRVSKMYASLTPKERARVDEFIDFL